MTDDPDARARIERILGHPIDLVLAGGGSDDPVVAVSRTAHPVRVRAAWVAADGQVVARLGCPPGVPSPARPITATLCGVAADGASDHLLLGQATPGVDVVLAVLAGAGSIPIDVHPGGVLAARLPRDALPVALEALTAGGESIGRLLRAGIHEVALVAGRVEGRLGASHGMAAGFGRGRTLPGLAAAEREAGYPALLPARLPDGFAMTTVRVEPEAAYPFAPPSIAIAWRPASGDARVLLRQGPGPLAVPEQADARGREVAVGPVTGVLRSRGMAFLVWEHGTRAFGLQVRGVHDPDATALWVARSLPAPDSANP